MADKIMHDVIILGSGPAGLTAALYCARAKKDVIVLGGDTFGGQLTMIPVLENYPGWNGSGIELAMFMKKQAETFGAKVLPVSVHDIAGNDKDGFSLAATDGKIYCARCVIIATGASPRKLQIDGARELTGRGVSYCATCDGFFYSGKDVIVLGGGNSALNDALYLADVANSVTIVYRKDAFTRAEIIVRDRVMHNDKIKCMFNTDLKKVAPTDDDRLVVTTLDDKEIVTDGLFVAIGHEANTDFLTEDVKRDDMGRLAAEVLPAGVFVAGDVKSNIKMQVATAVGTGCSAAMDAIAYLNTK